MRPISLLSAALLLSAGLSAQVPDGWYVWCSFQGVAGQCGVFFSHPRDPLQAFLTVTGLSADLAYDPAGKQGAATVIRRPSDGALLVGERAPQGSSVDLHVLTLRGTEVVRAALFSVGTSAGAGEIPQCALLPDGRVLLAATDLTAGPLAQFLTQAYNYEGVGILDTKSGLLSVVPIANLNQFPGVINSLTASPDGKTAYIGNYISTTSGDLWAVPLPQGGTAVRIAQFPAGSSNVAVDVDGSILVTTLNGPPNLFRVDPVSFQVTTVTTSTGPLNAITVETVTGEYVIATANAGVPPRSLIRMTRSGQESTLASPNRATISGIAVNPNPEAYGAGTPGQNTYSWVLGPDGGGLPLLGNQGFKIAVDGGGTGAPPALMILGTARAGSSMPPVLGIQLHVDPASIVAAPILSPLNGRVTLPLPIPSDPSLTGLALYAQTVHLESSTTYAASPGLEFTIL
ncbi:MAG: hypothetical protein IT458_09045 [Planctomycetes bacterium]|nr:hypothetical protein [Planctomycetota bacterium]